MDAEKLAEELREALMRQHDIAIGRDDPILMLASATQILVEKQATSQQELLREFREEMESFALQFSDEQKLRAERILNAALDAAKGSLTDLAENYRQALNQSTSRPAEAPAASTNPGDKGQALLYGLAGGVGAGLVLAIALVLPGMLR